MLAQRLHALPRRQIGIANLECNFCLPDYFVQAQHRDGERHANRRGAIGAYEGDTRSLWRLRAQQRFAPGHESIRPQEATDNIGPERRPGIFHRNFYIYWNSRLYDASGERWHPP